MTKESDTESGKRKVMEEETEGYKFIYIFLENLHDRGNNSVCMIVCVCAPNDKCDCVHGYQKPSSNICWFRPSSR